MPIIFNKTLFL